MNGPIQFCRSILRSLKHKIETSVVQKKMSALPEPLLNDSKQLSKLTKRELVARVVELQNFIKKERSSVTLPEERAFDFSKYGKRRIAIKFAYVGYDYDGFAKQEATQNTIEQYLMSALIRTKIIQPDVNCRYSKCGRTDKGVSAFEQVVSLDARSSLIKSDSGDIAESKQAFTRVSHETEVKTLSEFKHQFQSEIGQPDWEEISNMPVDGEVDYLTILNRNTPDDMYFYAWAPVPDAFNARFHCTHRCYKYFFPKCQLNINAMNEAAKLFVGTHNFQNFCKIDRTKKQIFTRNISEARVEAVTTDSSEDSFSTCCFIVKSEGFLYHQIRYMMSVLFLVGMGTENPSVVQELLDTDAFPEKPQFNLAADVPLVLHSVGYDHIKWIYREDVLSHVISKMQNQWTRNHLKTCVVRSMLNELQKRSPSPQGMTIENSKMIDLVNRKKYVPIKNRNTVKRKRLNDDSRTSTKRSRESDKESSG